MKEDFYEEMRSICFDSYQHVAQVLEEYDPILGELFNNIAKPIIERACYKGLDNNYDSSSIFSNNPILSGKQGLATNINVIPSDTEIDCCRACVVLADDEWKSGKNSFSKLSKQLITLWLDCQNINKSNLIMTTSWDEKSFNKLYKKQFDAYARNHSLVIVLLTTMGFSIVYLGKNKNIY